MYHNSLLIQTTVQMFGQILFMFLSPLCSSKMHVFDQKYSKHFNIVKYYYKVTVFYFNTFKSNLFLWSKLHFLQSCRNHSNMHICCSKNISDYQCWKQFRCFIYFLLLKRIHLSLLSLLIKSMHTCLEKKEKMSAGKWLITFKISFCLHNMCTVYIYYVYI